MDLDQTADASGADVAPAARRRPGSGAGGLAPGTTLGRYVVLEPLGRGAMGVVYRAFDPELARALAIKVVHLSDRSPARQAAAAARILREAQALARLSHPNVVAVHDFGRAGDDVYVVMELIQGQTLRAWLAARPRPLREIVRVFRAAGCGLAAAHAQGLVHRDFKPDNVLVGDDGVVRVVDFGLAHARSAAGATTTPTAAAGARERPTDRLAPVGSAGHRADRAGGQPRPDDGPDPPRADEGAAGAAATEGPGLPGASTLRSEQSGGGAPAGDATGSAWASDPSVGASTLLTDALTRHGAIVGTPAYMAPEQHLGDPTDPRTDQFAFCVALYEAIWAAAPFRGETVQARATCVIEGRLLVPPRLTLSNRWLWPLVQRGLARQPADRWPSMDPLLAALARDRTRPVWTGLLIAAGVGLGIATAALVRPPAASESICGDTPARVAALWSAPDQARVQAGFSADPRPYAAQAGAQTIALLDAWVRRWGELRQASCRPPPALGEPAEIDFARLACLDRRAVEFRAVVEWLVEAGAELVEHGEDVARALGPPERCDDPVEQRATAAPADPSQRARVEGAIARLAGHEVRLRAGQAGAVVGPLAELDAALADLDAPELRFRVAATWAAALDADGRAPEAEQAWLLALERAERAGDPRATARAMAQLATVVGDRQGRVKEGKTWARIAGAALARQPSPELQAELEQAAAFLASHEGDHAAELGHHERALAALGEVPDLDPARLVAAHTNLAGALAQLARWDEALGHGQAAWDLARERLGPGHPRTGLALGSLALVADWSGDSARAIELGQASVAILTDALPGDHPKVISLRNNLAIAYAHAGQLERAEAIFVEVLALRERGTAGPLDLASALNNLASVRRMRGLGDDALALNERALALRLTVLDADDPALAGSYSSLANAYEDRGELVRAVEYRERALALQTRALGPEHPELSVELGNLAWTLIELGQADQAEPHVARARALGGPPEVRADLRAFVRLVAAKLELARRRPAAACALADEALEVLSDDSLGHEERALRAELCRQADCCRLP